jgi:hypothetical protein
MDQPKLPLSVFFYFKLGVDIFTNKKYEDGGPTASNMSVPIVNKL